MYVPDQSDVSSDWYSGGRWFDPQVRTLIFCRVLVRNNFYSHSLPTADSRRAVVSYRRNDVHLVLVNRLGSLSRNSVAGVTNRLSMTLLVLIGL